MAKASIPKEEKEEVAPPSELERLYEFNQRELDAQGALKLDLDRHGILGNPEGFDPPEEEEPPLEAPDEGKVIAVITLQMFENDVGVSIEGEWVKVNRRRTGGFASFINKHVDKLRSVEVLKLRKEENRVQEAG